MRNFEIFFFNNCHPCSVVNMSEQRLKISSSVIERLNKIQDSTLGKLYGIKDDGALSILGFSVTSSNNLGEEEKNVCDIAFNYDILPHLPANVDVLGVFNVASTADVNEYEKKCLETQSKLTPALLHIEPDSKAIVAKLWKGNKYEKTNFEIAKDSYWKKFIHLRLTAKFCTSCSFDLETVKEAFSDLKKKIKCGAAFQLKDSNVFILENNVSGTGITEKSDVQDLKSITGSSNEKNKQENNNIINFNMYLSSCYDPSKPEIAPVIKYEKKCFKYARFNLPVDALSLVDLKTKVNNLYQILLESLFRSMTLLEECILKQFQNSDPNKISLPEIHHFFPQKCRHYISIAYPKKQMEGQLINIREIFHKALSLPMDIPLFRRGNAHSFVMNENPSTVLINPHEGLNPSGVVDGEVNTVQGSYAYHHYMQDGFDDSGWGCAYRSLQTIFSWFRLQGFTGRPVPTHKQIQQCLVDIGDKSSSFIGSKNWIGSTEVSFVLETMLGVTSRIVSVSSGEELSMKGGELSHHFKTQGTPIMIGGGVLAHTILGVDYNRKTGSLKFLILDPHYTGEDNLSIIQGKGWCGWKGMDFWKKNAFYNMCLPLRPKSI